MLGLNPLTAITSKAWLIIAGALLVALAGSVGYAVIMDARHAREIAELKVTMGELEAARDKAIRANEVNVETIKQLKADKVAADATIARLNAERRKIQADLDRIRAEIVANPAYVDGALSPVLRETIRAIQGEGASR